MVASKKKEKGFFKRLFTSNDTEPVITPPPSSPSFAQQDPDRQKLESLIVKLYEKMEANDKKIEDLSSQNSQPQNPPINMGDLPNKPNQNLADPDLFNEEIKKHIQAEIEKNLSSNKPKDNDDLMHQIDKKLEDKISNLLSSPNAPTPNPYMQEGLTDALDDELEKSLDDTLENYGQKKPGEEKFSKGGRRGNYEDLKGISKNREPKAKKKKRKAGHPLELTHKAHEVISPTSPYRHHLRSLQNSHLFIKEKEYQMALDVYGRLQSKIPNREIKEKLQDNINDIQDYLDSEEEEEDRLSSLVSMVMDRLPKKDDNQNINAENLGDSLARSLTEALSNIEKGKDSTNFSTDPRNPPIIEIDTGGKPIEVKIDKNSSSNFDDSKIDDSVDQPGSDKIKDESKNKNASPDSSNNTDKKTQTGDPNLNKNENPKQSVIDTNKVVQEIKQGFFEVQKAMFNSEKMEVHTSGDAGTSSSNEKDGENSSTNDAKDGNEATSLPSLNQDGSGNQASSTGNEEPNTPRDINEGIPSLSSHGGMAQENNEFNEAGHSSGVNGNEDENELESLPSIRPLGSGGANALDSPISGSSINENDNASPLGGGGVGGLGGAGGEDDDDYDEKDEDEIEAPPQEIRGIFELKASEEEDTPFLTLTYDFNNIPHKFALSKDHNILEYVYYKYKPMLTKAQKFIKRKQITKALNYYRVISDQYIPEEFKKMIDRNIEDITEYLQKFLVARK